ncbi:MAG: hypothetical protein ACLSB9_31570 [Hydrogeniiclostridium mannosilyticum]
MTRPLLPRTACREEERVHHHCAKRQFSWVAPGVQSYEATYYMNNFYEGLVEYRTVSTCLPATDWLPRMTASPILSIWDDVQFNDGIASMLRRSSSISTI